MIKSETLKGTLCGKLIEVNHHYDVDSSRSIYKQDNGLIELLSYIAEKLNAGQKQGDQIYNNFECRFNWEVIE